MKRMMILLSFMMLSVFVSGQGESNVYWSMRMNPKMDKIGELEKKLPVFLKTHYPQMSFRVYEAITGENSGSFLVITGPFAMKDMDVPMVSPKGEALQKADGLALSALCESSEVNMTRLQTDLGIPNPNRQINMILATTRVFESGTWDEYEGLVKKIKEAREKGKSKMDIAYHRPTVSGATNVIHSIRYLNSWADLDIEEDLAAMYDNAHGRAAWSKTLDRLTEITKSTKQEMRVLRKDLSVTAVK
jgi:hypothetical protein